MQPPQTREAVRAVRWTKHLAHRWAGPTIVALLELIEADVVSAQELNPSDCKLLIEALSDSPEFATVRQRQIIVRHALSGYPLSDELDRPLRYPDWEGSSLVVADDLMRLLEGHEAAPGVPALWLTALEVESIARPARRRRLEKMRRRLPGSMTRAARGSPKHATPR